MSTIQTVITENSYKEELDLEVDEVFFLEESPDVVKSSITFKEDLNGFNITRKVYSLEEYMAANTKPLSVFCPPAPKKGIWWLAVEDIEYVFSRTSLGISQYTKIMMDYANSPSKEMSKHFHVTLDFDVAAEDNPHCAWAVEHNATSFTIKVKGLAYNDKAACLVVELDPKSPDCCNKVAHITLATADGVPPVYSNHMLAGVDGAYQFLPLEAELEGTLEFFQFQ